MAFNSLWGNIGVRPPSNALNSLGPGTSCKFSETRYGKCKIR